jgi:hypothetical protein
MINSFSNFITIPYFERLKTEFYLRTIVCPETSKVKIEAFVNNYNIRRYN